MLELRPTCEHCQKQLLPTSSDALICSYECTFCKSCVENLLNHICPNCGGNFVSRPIRPSQEWRKNTSLHHHPAKSVAIHKPINLSTHAMLLTQIGTLEPNKR